MPEEVLYRDEVLVVEPHGNGSVRWVGLLGFVIGIAVSVPFMATKWYTGPIGKALGGADFSYTVSFIVAGAIYLAAGRPLRSRDSAWAG